MKKIATIACLLVILIAATVHAQIPRRPNKTDVSGKKQGNWVVMFNASRKRVTTADSAVYYRLISYRDNKPSGVTKDYFRNGTLQWEGIIVEEEPLVLEGLITEYNSDKTIKQLDVWASGKQDAAKTLEAYLKLVATLRTTPKVNEAYLVDKIEMVGTQYQNASDFSSALPYFEEAVALRAKVPGKQTPEYAMSLHNVCWTRLQMGDYTEALPVCHQAADQHRAALGEKSAEYALSLTVLGMVFESMSQFDSGEYYYKHALHVREQLGQQEKSGYLSNLQFLGRLYSTMGDQIKAEAIGLQCLALSEKISGKESIPYGRALNNLAGVYSEQGNYRLCAEYIERARDIFEKHVGKNHRFYGLLTANLGVPYARIGRMKDAEAAYLQAMPILEAALGADHPTYLQQVNNLAWVYLDEGKYAKAETLYKVAMEKRRKLGADHVDYIMSVNQLAKLYDYMGKDAEAEVLYRQGNVKNYGYDDLNSERFAEFYFDRDRLAEADTLYARSVAIRLNELRNNFIYMSEYQRELFYNTNRDFLNNYNSFCVARYVSRPAITGMMYDLQLDTKAMLLNNSTKWKQRIRQSGDASLLAQYQEWESLAKRLAKAESEGTDAENLQVLRTKTETLEKSLTERSEDFVRAIEKKVITWKDIAAGLKPDEAAIEIIQYRKRGVDRIIVDSSDINLPRYPYHGLTDTLQYAVLIVKPGIENPELVLLENGNDLEGKYLKNYQNSIQFRTSDKLSFEQYWARIAKRLTGVRKVYLSGDGVYHRINVNTLRNPKTGKYVMDELLIILVSNTRDLLRNTAESSNNRYAVLAGMPDYNISDDARQKYAQTVSENRAPSDSDAVRSIESFNELPGTKEEVERVASLLRQKQWKVDVLLNEEASEENIKQSFKPVILHIATHGYFRPDHSADEGVRVKNPLLQSGLILAGAGSASSSNSGDDGILTAYECMLLNLDDTEVVVLSACETGLGEIRNGQGVYGLQRAFIVAGARSVVMSLWKVDDQTTQQLMVLFYQKMLSGMARGPAFREAQLELRKKHPDPYHWAAFVMIGEQ